MYIINKNELRGCYIKYIITTFVELIDPVDIMLAQSLSLSQFSIGPANRNDCRVAVLGEGVFGVVHNAPIIILFVQCVDFIRQ